MQNNSQNPLKATSGKTGLLIVLAVFGVVVIAVIVRFIPWMQIDPTPKPLGSGLEYIGKKDYCPGFILVICDGYQGTTYFYATDMSLEEVQKYFKGAVVKETQVQFSTEEEGEQYRLSFIGNNSSKNGFYIIFYNNGRFTAQKYSLEPIKKKHLVEIDYSNYEASKRAL